MFTEPEIISSKDPNVRAYVKVYIDGERHRFYNGKFIDIKCNPNRAKTLKDRDKALAILHYSLKRKLEDGWKPGQHTEVPVSVVRNFLIGDTFSGVLKDLQEQDLSKLYKRDINLVGNSFIKYLKAETLYEQNVYQVGSNHIEQFLKQYKHSATYYMNKRRTLGGIFSRLVAQKIIPENPVHATSQLKEKPTLHQAYTKQQLHQVLNYLEEHSPNLHLCALLMYGCLLRPHQEIRQLYRSDLNEDCTVIALSGSDNKSGRVRIVPVPEYVRKVIIQRNLHLLSADTNLFTSTSRCFNDSYFNTMWSRLKDKLMKAKVIGEAHTMYSFRHTAAINLYLKTKDLFKVQQALGHSSMLVTLTYMRSLGILNASNAEDVPDL